MRTPKSKPRQWIGIAVCLMGIGVIGACALIAVENRAQLSAGPLEREQLSSDAPASATGRARPTDEVAALTSLGFNIRGWT